MFHSCPNNNKTVTYKQMCKENFLHVYLRWYNVLSFIVFKK